MSVYFCVVHNTAQKLVETAYIRTKALGVGIMAVEQNARYGRGMARIGRSLRKLTER